jgi:hypothetical protein
MQYLAEAIRTSELWISERRELALFTDDDAVIEPAPGISRALLGGPAPAG